MSTLNAQKYFNHNLIHNSYFWNWYNLSILAVTSAHVKSEALIILRFIFVFYNIV